MIIKLKLALSTAGSKFVFPFTSISLPLPSSPTLHLISLNFPHSSVSKESACNAGDPSSIPGLGRVLEKEMATHSSILVWRIPWTEEPGRLQSMGLQESPWITSGAGKTGQPLVKK